MKKSLLMLAVCATVAVSVFFTGCPNSAGGGGGIVSAEKGLHLASSGYSAFMTGVINQVKTGFFMTNVGDPHTFAIKGSDISSKKDFDVMLQAGLSGKNIIIDAPTKDQLKALAAAIESHLNANESLRAQYNGASYNPLEFLLAQFDDLSGTEKAYEAVGLRGRQIYYVHCFDGEPDEEQEDSEPGNPSANIRSAGVSENIRAASRAAANDDDIKTFATEKFSDWILKVGDKAFNARYMSAKDMAGLRALGDVPDINNLVQAQSFYHTWYPHGYKHFEDRKEALELVVDVWPACDMDAQQDYYLVHHEINANNDQLGYESNDDYDGPYMYWLSLLSTINKNYQTPRDLSPTTTEGNTTITTGSSVSVTGTVGVSATGPSLSVSVGGTWSHSSTTSVPDITIEQNLDDNRPSFKFSGPQSKDRDYKAKDIQKNRASFDTYSVFVLPSSYSDPKYNQVKLWSYPNICIRYYDRNANMFYSFKQWKWFWHTVIKPSNAKKNYIMNFTAPDNYSVQEIAVLQAAVQTFNEFWGANVPYLAVGADKLDSVATNYFASAMDVVTKNKNVLQDSGFKGNFTFYIQDPSTGTQLKTQDVEF